MAGPYDLTGQNIEDTYQRILQTPDGSTFYDGTGSLVTLPSANTASLLVTASATSNTITFTKGDGSTFPVTVAGGDTTFNGYNATASFSSQSTWIFNHNLNSQFAIVQALDVNYNQIVPSNIELVSTNQVILTFPISQSGYAIASLGGDSHITVANNGVVKGVATFLDFIGGATTVTYASNTASINIVGYNATASFSSQSIWTFNHNLGSQLVVVQAVDTNYNQIIPSSITLNGINQATLTFPVSQSGYVIASLGGDPISSSYATTASYALNIPKAGEVSSASFGGNPYTASVIFGTTYLNNSYAVVITGEDYKNYTVNNKQNTGFTINTNSNVLFSGSVYWQATPYNS